MSLAEKKMELQAKGIEAFGPNDVQTLVSHAVTMLADVSQGQTQVVNALAAVIDQLNAPKTSVIVRDERGRAAGVKTITQH